MFKKSAYQSLCEVIPGGVNSPVRSCLAVGQTPLIADRGQGDCLYDVEGREFIDFCLSWGPLIHGHAHPEIIKAIEAQLVKGTTFGVSTWAEEKLARKVTQLMPAIEQVRFVSSGTESTMSAVRLARGFTGRDLIIKFAGHYHGHADFFLVRAGSGVMELASASSIGIPSDFIKHTLCLPFNDLEAVDKVFQNPEVVSRLACVILEPIAGNMGLVPATHSFMHRLREETLRCGSLLILDEVITGFRVSLGGAQEWYGIKPDLTCLGKIIGGGLPAAAFGGRRDIMQYLAPTGPVYQAGTLSGNPLAMAAGLKTLELLEKPHFYEDLQRKTELFLKPIQEHIEKQALNMCVQQAGSAFTLFFGKKAVHNMDDAAGCDKDRFGKFFRYLFAKGIYIPPMQQEAWFLCSAHTAEHLQYAQKTIIEFLLTAEGDGSC
jgi:glutamate-1-semialdehyde 2,1-aminomutase